MTDLDRIDREELPVVPGEIVGWRAWIVATRGSREPRLRSLYFDVYWPTDDWLRAEALEDGGRWVELHGICAALDRDHLLSLHRYGSSSAPRYVEGNEYERSGVAAIGQVGLAGLIVPGTRGFRAERARPLSVVLPYVAWELVEPLRRAYGVPVTLGNILVNPGGQHGHRS